ncbi:MAG: hypothetical protein ACX939_14880, partial [Hyphococcus sp.]
ITIDAPIGRELRAAGAAVRLNANVGGDAHLTGQDIEIGPNVRIAGDLRHRAQSIDIDPSVVVDGDIIALEPETGASFEEWSVQAAAAMAVFALAFLIGFGVLVIATALILPSLMNSASAMIREKPFATLGVGVLIVFAAPAVMAFLFMTLLGAPLALMIALIYIAAAPIALAAFVYFLGMQGRRMLTKSSDKPGIGSRFIWSALATGVMIVISLIPLLGGLVWLLGYIVGMGAVMTRGGKALALKA